MKSIGSLIVQSLLNEAKANSNYTRHNIACPLSLAFVILKDVISSVTIYIEDPERSKKVERVVDPERPTGVEREF